MSPQRRAELLELSTAQLRAALTVVECTLDRSDRIPVEARGNLVRAAAELRDALVICALGPDEPEARAGHVSLPIMAGVPAVAYELTALGRGELERVRW